MNAVGVFTVMGALAGWVLGTATGARPAFVAVVCGIVALESSATAAALDDPDRARAWRRMEFVALIVGVKLLHLFSIPRELAAAEIADLPRSIFENETLTGWVAGFMVWALVLATIGDLEVLASGVDDARESPVVVRVRTRLVATTAVLTLAAAYAAVGFAGVMTLRRSGERGVFWVVSLFLGIGLLGLARVSYAAAAGRWMRDGAVVEGPIQSRWMASAWIVAVVVLAVGIAAGGLSGGVSGLPAIGVAKLGPVGEWIADALERIGERQALQPGAGVEVPAPADTLPDGGPEPGSRAGVRSSSGWSWARRSPSPSRSAGPFRPGAAGAGAPWFVLERCSGPWPVGPGPCWPGWPGRSGRHSGWLRGSGSGVGPRPKPVGDRPGRTVRRSGIRAIR